MIQRYRQRALEARRELSAEYRQFASSVIAEKLLRTSHFRAAKNIACYLPMRDEVDTNFLIERAWRANKRIFVPIALRHREMFFREIRPDSELRRNKMSILEPVSGEIIPPRQLQLVVTPLVAFDEFGHRIGMGGGYYDRCFSFLRNRSVWLQPKLFGFAFNCQKIEEISPNTWDVRLYRCITEVE